MPTLHVRSVPEDLYDRVRQLAQLRSRSLGAQVVTMLYEALDEEEQRKDQARARPPSAAAGLRLPRRLLPALTFCARIAGDDGCASPACR
jgi:plasmid stability protein